MFSVVQSSVSVAAVYTALPVISFCGRSGAALGTLTADISAELELEPFLQRGSVAGCKRFNRSVRACLSVRPSVRYSLASKRTNLSHHDYFTDEEPEDCFLPCIIGL